MNIYIETPNLTIRTFLNVDAKDVAYYSQQPKVAYWMSDMIFKSKLEALNWITWINEQLNKEDPFIVLAIEHKIAHKCIGVVGIHKKTELNNEVELLYAISDDYQCKGYATEAAKGLVEWVLKNTVLKDLVAIIKPDNIPSQAVIKKLGFKYADTRVILYDGNMCEFNYYKL